ncbi:hypothetical protein DBV39_01245 [Orrella marina]|uniref:Uncharacterized protein n=1 Tax=Orrella marina TaxID=2163011 RepID=A0A2R4XFI5_9BURK|nr:hypothetical protein DBV39_01245 [Orrella marina]
MNLISLKEWLTTFLVIMRMQKKAFSFMIKTTQGHRFFIELEGRCIGILTVPKYVVKDVFQGVLRLLSALHQRRAMLCWCLVILAILQHMEEIFLTRSRS